MGGASDDVVAFVDAPKEHVAEVNRPDAVVDFLQPHGMLFERVGQEEQALLEADGPGIGDPLDDEVSGIFHRRQRAGVRAGRAAIERRRRATAQGLVRPLVIEEAPEGIERPLLGDEIRPGRADRLALERLVHALVRPILVGARWQDPLMLNSEPQPPDVQLREPVNPGGGERHPVVGSNRARQTVFAKHALEDGSDPVAFRREQPVAGQQIARVLVGDRQGVAIDPVARAEVPFEVGRPQIVGVGRPHRHDARVLVSAPAATFLHQPAAGEKISGGADRGHVHGRMPRPQPRQQLGRPPTRMLAPRGADHGRHVLRDPMRAGMRRAAPIEQALAAAFVEALEPLVARLPADGVPRAELAHRVQAPLMLANEPLSLVHG